MAGLIPSPETAIRAADGQHVQAEARELLGDTHQAAAAMMVKLGEIDTAWMPRTGPDSAPRLSGRHSPSRRACSGWPHVFLALSQIDQAHHVANSIAQALEPQIAGTAEPEDSPQVWCAFAPLKCCDNFLYGFKGAPSARHAYGRNRLRELA